MNDKKILKHYVRTPSAVVGSFILLAFFLVALFGPSIAPHNPYDLSLLSLSDRLKPPFWMNGGDSCFILGTDDQGRDILSTMLYGSRTSLLVGLGAVSLAVSIGAALGLISGFYGSFVGAIIMRLADMLFSFSTLLVAIIIMAILRKQGVSVVIFAIALVGWVKYARTIRGNVLAVREEEYIVAAKAIGVSDSRIILRHLLPNTVAPLLVVAAVDFGIVIMTEATLSFLGIGVPLTTPSLGAMISSGRQYLYSGKWWLVVFPGLELLTVVLGLNLLADWLREELNPKLKGRR
jgi:peptide/nickel transport system permease protein